jgi:hypothetical protein
MYPLNGTDGVPSTRRDPHRSLTPPTATEELNKNSLPALTDTFFGTTVKDTHVRANAAASMAPALNTFPMKSASKSMVGLVHPFAAHCTTTCQSGLARGPIRNAGDDDFQDIDPPPKSLKQRDSQEARSTTAACCETAEGSHATRSNDNRNWAHSGCPRVATRESQSEICQAFRSTCGGRCPALRRCTPRA